MQKSKQGRFDINNEGPDHLTVNQKHKSRLFEMIFSEKRELLKLYNAVNGTDYDDPERLEVNTLENAIYMSMHNDLSFIIDSRLTLYEHQSTYSPNLPFRFLMYVADLYSAITKGENLYGTRLLRLPTPRFIIFYNGRVGTSDVVEWKLSDSFTVPEDEYSLELKATMLNINKGHNEGLLKTCKTLGDYAEYTERVRINAKTMSLQKAVELAVEECIRDGVLSEFLSNNRAEAVKMSIYEYDEEKTMRQMKEEGEQYFAALSEKLLRDMREEDLLRAVNDKELREVLYREYGLKE